MTRLSKILLRYWRWRWEKTVVLLFRNQHLYWLRFYVDKKLLFSLLLLCFWGSKRLSSEETSETVIPIFSNSKPDFTASFLEQKQLLIAHFLIEEQVPHLSKLSDESLLALNEAISEVFMEEVFSKLTAPEHVKRYFADTTDLNKLETALMEQAKYGIPASIKLAQSALETAYGQKVVENNYFGIKAKSGTRFITTEYLTAQELKQFSGRILEKKQINKKGVAIYRCKVQDTFATYPSAWSSFRAHSEFLSRKVRYAPLFVKGKDYQAWAEHIPKVGYATSPEYSKLLKHIIRRYHLYLLDH